MNPPVAHRCRWLGTDRPISPSPRFTLHLHTSAARHAGAACGANAPPAGVQTAPPDRAGGKTSPRHALITNRPNGQSPRPAVGAKRRWSSDCERSDGIRQEKSGTQRRKAAASGKGARGKAARLAPPQHIMTPESVSPAVPTKTRTRARCLFPGWTLVSFFVAGMADAAGLVNLVELLCESRRVVGRSQGGQPGCGVCIIGRSPVETRAISPD
jgi:hypothetical protein